MVNRNYPYLLYNLSGGISNILWSGVFIALFITLKNILPFAAEIFIPFIGAGVFMGSMNLLPLKLSGVATDGHNIMTMKKNETARLGFYYMLLVNASIVEGIRYRDMPAEWSELPNNFNDSLSVAFALTHFNLLLDKHDFKAAKDFAERILTEADKIIEVYKNELRCELLFFEIIEECRTEEIERLYTDDLKKYMKASSTQLSKRRLAYAYQKLVAFNEGEAEKELVKFNKTCLTTPYKGELALEQELIYIVNDKAKSLVK
jgi:hypothetical protein